MKRICLSSVFFLCAALILILLAGCSSQPKVRRVDSGEVTDLSGKWNDTDSRIVSQKMISDMLKLPWYNDWTAAKNAKPVVIVGRVSNNTTEHINTGAFMADIERELINSGKISFVAGGQDREATRRERLDQIQNSSDETIKDFGKEIGADFILFGTIGSFVDQAGGQKAISYQIDLTLVDIEKNLKVWAGQEKIKKLISRNRLKL